MKRFASRAPLTDSELATFPCAYSTAEGLLQRAGVSTERVLITGASGGVGSALVQLAAMRGADVTAVASPDNHQALRDLGAHRLVARDASLLEELGDSTIDVVHRRRRGRFVRRCAEDPHPSRAGTQQQERSPDPMSPSISEIYT